MVICSCFFQFFFPPKMYVILRVRIEYSSVSARIYRLVQPRENMMREAGVHSVDGVLSSLFNRPW